MITNSKLSNLITNFAKEKINSYSDLTSKTKEILYTWSKVDTIDPNKPRGIQNILNHNYDNPSIVKRYRVYAYDKDVTMLERFDGKEFKMIVDGKVTNEVIGTQMSNLIDKSLNKLINRAAFNLLAQKIYGKDIIINDKFASSNLTIEKLKQDLTSQDINTQQNASLLLASMVYNQGLSILKRVDRDILNDEVIKSILKDNSIEFNYNEDGSIYGKFGNSIIYSNNTDTINISDPNLKTYGGNNKTKIYGTSGDDIIYGGDDNDIIYGYAGNDELYGGDGDDILMATDKNGSSFYGHDILSGGKGDDTLIGSSRNTTFIYNYGDGNDIIRDNGNVGKGKDVLRLDDISIGDIKVKQSNRDVIILIKNRDSGDFTKGSIKIENFFGSGFMESIQFKDKTINGDELTQMIPGFINKETLFISDDISENLTFNAITNEIKTIKFSSDIKDLSLQKQGDDLVIYLRNNTITLTNWAYGNVVDKFILNDKSYSVNEFFNRYNFNEFIDTFKDNSYVIDFSKSIIVFDKKGDDTIYFSDNIIKSDLKFKWIEGTNDIAITNDKFKDITITLKDIYKKDSLIEKIVFANSDIIEGKDIISYLATNDSDIFNGFEYTKNSINALDGNDIIKTYGYDDVINGGNGDDHIDAGGGDDTVMGGNGDDEIYGGNGSDTIYGNNGNDILYGDSGNDYIDGGNGNDKLYGGDGDDILKGFLGDDFLKGEAGNDTYLYEGKEFGNDTILNLKSNLDELDIIEFKDLRFKDLEIAREFNGEKITNNLIIKVKPTLFKKHTSSIKVLNFFNDDSTINDNYKIDLIKTKDKVLSSSDILNTVFKSTPNDDIIKLSNTNAINSGLGNDIVEAVNSSIIKTGLGNDILIGSKENDILKGGAGSDTYIYHKNGGLDTIIDDLGSDDKLVLLKINSNDTNFFKRDNDLILKFDDNNQIIIKNHFLNIFGRHNLIETFKFSNTTLKADEIEFKDITNKPNINIEIGIGDINIDIDNNGISLNSTNDLNNQDNSFITQNTVNKIIQDLNSYSDDKGLNLNFNTEFKNSDVMQVYNV